MGGKPRQLPAFPAKTGRQFLPRPAEFSAHSEHDSL